MRSRMRSIESQLSLAPGKCANSGTEAEYDERPARSSRGKSKWTRDASFGLESAKMADRGKAAGKTRRRKVAASTPRGDSPQPGSLSTRWFARRRFRFPQFHDLYDTAANSTGASRCAPLRGPRLRALITLMRSSNSCDVQCFLVSRASAACASAPIDWGSPSKIMGT